MPRTDAPEVALRDMIDNAALAIEHVGTLGQSEFFASQLHQDAVIRRLEVVGEAARAVLPPLLRGYLRLGARICGEPAHDPAFGVADFVALLNLHDADARYLARLRSAAEQADRVAAVPA